MKNNKLLLTFCLTAGAFLSIFITGCWKDGGKSLKHVTLYKPVYGSKSAALASINGDPTTRITKTGKIFVKDTYVFVSEQDKGIHVIDYSNPVSPKQTAFLSIPGNLDIAIKGNILYADMFADLLAIDISDLTKVKIVDTVKNFFTGRMYAYGVYTSPDDKIVIGWNEKDTIVDESRPVTVFAPGCINCSTLAPSAAFAAAFSDATKSTGGSMAAMVAIHDRIYAIAEPHSLGIINISDAANPKHESTIQAGFDLETIYPFQDKLFLGSSTGLFIFDINDPAHPTAKGTFTHGRACDPVITDGSYAYVTLRSGSWCGGSTNELNVVNVSNLTSPSLVKTYPMTNPAGLGKDGNLLFIGDGDAVKIYDAKEPADLKLLKALDIKNTYDVIVGNNKLLLVAASGLYLFNYTSDGSSFTLLSKIPVGKLY